LEKGRSCHSSNLDPPTVESKMRLVHGITAVCLAFAPLLASAFAPSQLAPWAARPFAKQSDTSCLATSKTSLDTDTTWRFRFVLNGIPTEKGKRVDELFVVEAQFVEEDGYEPPQGNLKIVPRGDAGDRILKISKSRWQLSEDPEDRKDGLWVWGLFKEPLYPFMLLQLETEAVPLAGEDGDTIKPLKLFAQINHKREKDVGVILSGGELKVRVVETLKADPFGAATVDVYSEDKVGQIRIEAM